MKVANDGKKALAEAGGNLDQVREILFGTQIRESEKRFTRFEERLSREAAELRSELKNRFDSLEGYIKSEVKSLAERIKLEQGERASAIKDLSKGLAELTKTAERRMTELGERATKEQQKLRNQILEQSKSLRNEFQRGHQEQADLFEQACDELRSDKVDRVALAGLFTDLAVRLGDDRKRPANGSR